MEPKDGSAPRARPEDLRQTLLVYPSFQLKLILTNLAVMAGSMTLAALQIKRSFSRVVELGQKARIPGDHPYFRFLSWQEGQIYAYFAVSFLLACLISTLATLLISNKVAGPIVRLRSHFQQILRSGKIEREVHFREGDFFPDLPRIINLAMAKLTRSRRTGGGSASGAASDRKAA